MEKEVTKSSKILAKKAWNILRIMLIMIKKQISSNNFIMDLNLVLNKCNQWAKKAFHGLCWPNNHPTHYFISPKHYEFSCSNSPAVGPIHPYLIMAHYNRTKSKSKYKPREYSYKLEDATTMVAVQQILDMINMGEVSPNSPRGWSTLPGFGNGKSPMVRQLRITDSPFPLKDGKGSIEEEEEDVKVNKAVEEFIKMFHHNLKMQKCVESPYHITIC